MAWLSQYDVVVLINANGPFHLTQFGPSPNLKIVLLSLQNTLKIFFFFFFVRDYHILKSLVIFLSQF